MYILWSISSHHFTTSWRLALQLQRELQAPRKYTSLHCTLWDSSDRRLAWSEWCILDTLFCGRQQIASKIRKPMILSSGDVCLWLPVSQMCPKCHQSKLPLEERAVCQRVSASFPNLSTHIENWFWRKSFGFVLKNFWGSKPWSCSRGWQANRRPSSSQQCSVFDVDVHSTLSLYLSHLSLGTNVVASFRGIKSLKATMESVFKEPYAWSSVKQLQIQYQKAW